MPRASPAIESFNAGELSPYLGGRPSLQKYAAGCAHMENFVPVVQGAARFRPGTRYVGAALYASHPSYLTRFEFNYEQASVLEWADGSLAFWTDRARLIQTLTVTGAANDGTGRIRLTVTGHNLAAGMTVTVADVGGVPNATGTWVIETPTANAVDLVSSTWSGAYTAGGTLTCPYHLITPYTAASLVNPDGSFALSQVQSGDVIYLAGGGAPPQKLSRNAVDDWTIAEYIPDDGPFMDMNEDEDVTVTADGVTGTVTLTASDPIFTAAHVGVLMRLERQDTRGVQPWEPDITIGADDRRRLSDGHEYLSKGASDGAYPSQTGTVQPTHTRGRAHDSGEGANTGIIWEYQNSGYGVVRITSYTSATEVDAEVLEPLPQGVMDDGTWRWSFGAWGEHNEYPQQVALWKDRLVWAGVRDVWLSKSGEYEKMAPDEFNELVTTAAINVRIQSQDNNAIRWVAAADALMVGTADAEYMIVPATTSDPVGPENIAANVMSEWGGSGVTPVKVGKAIFFAEKGRTRLREVTTDNGYEANDATLLADHMTAGGVVAMAHQKRPHSILWAARSDGRLLGYTYEPKQEVFAWHRHDVGGVVESMAVIPAPDGEADDLWLSVQRTVAGQSVRYIERLEHWLAEDGEQADAFHVDCGLTYDGAAATTISGLEHLEGEEVAIVADGAAHPTRTVSGGAITLQEAAEVVHVGLLNRGRLKTMRLDAGSGEGSSQGKTKRLSRVTVRVHRSLGGKVGTSFDSMETIETRRPADSMDSAPPLYSGDVLVRLTDGFDTDGYLCVEQDQPLPLNLLALYPQLTTSDA